MHYAAPDPWVEAEEEVVPLRDAVTGAGADFEEYTYPGSGHLFADPDLPEYDLESSEKMWERVLSTPEGREPRALCSEGARTSILLLYLPGSNGEPKS